MSKTESIAPLQTQKEKINSPSGILLRDKMQFSQKGIGYFPLLEPFIQHGFAWGPGTVNYSYLKEPGYPSEQSILTVKKRVGNLLKSLNIPQNTEIITVRSPVNIMSILDLNDRDLRSTTITNYGRTVEAATVFTTRNDIVLTTPASDCLWGIIYAVTDKRKPITGLTHGSRRQLDGRSVELAIEHLINHYKCDPKSIKVGITPGLSKKYHTLNYIELKNVPKWKQYLTKRDNETVEVDSLGYALDQYQENGVQQIEAYSNEVCTYKEALSGNFYISFRYSQQMNRPELNNRTLIITKLKP